MGYLEWRFGIERFFPSCLLLPRTRMFRWLIFGVCNVVEAGGVLVLRDFQDRQLESVSLFLQQVPWTVVPRGC